MGGWVEGPNNTCLVLSFITMDINYTLGSNSPEYGVFSSQNYQGPTQTLTPQLWCKTNRIPKPG